MAVQTEQVPHHIVIIGGGAGGLELATQLGDSFTSGNPYSTKLRQVHSTQVLKKLIILHMRLNIIMSLFWVVLSA